MPPDYVTRYIFSAFTTPTPIPRTRFLLWMSFLVEVTKSCTCYSNYFKKKKVKRTVGTLSGKTKLILASLSTAATKCNAYKKEIKVLSYFERCGKQCRPSLQSTVAEREVEFFPGHLDQEEDSGPELVTYILKSPPGGDQMFQPMTLRTEAFPTSLLIMITQNSLRPLFL